VKKLLNLKPWLTIPDAARHLSILFGEDVSEADVLRLGLDGHLKLSVYFVNGARGRCGPAVRAEDAKRTVREENPKDWVGLTDGASAGKGEEDFCSCRMACRSATSETELLEVINDLIGLTGSSSANEGEKLLSVSLHGLPLGDGRVLEYVRETELLDGIWDLTMLGHERLEIEQRYQLLTEGPDVDMGFRDGPLDYPIVSREDGIYCQIYEPRDASDRYHPADGLPADAVIVVRTSALHDLEARLSEPDRKAEKPLGKRERETLLVIIAALAKMAKIDVTRPSAAAAAIGSQTDLMGAGVSPRAIEDHLKRIPGALEEFK